MELRFKTFEFIKNIKACHIYFFTAHYVNLPFGDVDKKEVKKWVERGHNRKD